MKRWLIAFPLLCLLVYVAVRTAWMADDAYITFRVSDNFLAGHGLRWNTYERVQAYTNPLWMIVVTIALAITREAFITISLLQVGITLFVGVLIVRGARTVWSAALALVLLCSSRAFIDFSASGMENALAHLLVVAWVGAVLHSTGSPRAAKMHVFFASLLMVTRLDLAILVFPAFAGLARGVLRAASDPRRAFVRAIAIGALPIAAWEVFAFVYYGSFIPNSARAKLTSGFSQSRFLESGANYFWDSLRIDPLTLTATIAIVLVALSSKRRRPIAFGVLALLAYVLVVGGDFMSGRFFTIPFAAAVALAADLRIQLGAFSVGGAIAAALAAKVGAPTITDRFQKVPPVDIPVVDCRLAFHIFTGLTEPRSEGPSMYPEFIRFGRMLRLQEAPPVLPAIGIAGYYAGPDVRIIDAFALSDPLRSRLPIPDAANEATLKMGHFMRPAPEGYVETVRTNKNTIRHPDLHAYYDTVSFVTQGPIFSALRLLTALELELGMLDEPRERFLATYSEKPVQLKWLPPQGVPPEQVPALACYSWWKPCADSGYAFTETGLRVVLGRTAPASHLTLDLAPEPYDLVFRRGDQEIGRQSLVMHEAVTTVTIPSNGYDTISIQPKAGKGVRRLSSMQLLP